MTEIRAWSTFFSPTKTRLPGGRPAFLDDFFMNLGIVYLPNRVRPIY